MDRVERWREWLRHVGPLSLLPASAMSVVKELARHVLRHPVVGVMGLAADAEGKILLIRRADTGKWSLVGGTVEWGETVREALVREFREEAAMEVTRVGDVVGVYSRADRDVRFHAVTVLVRVQVREATKQDGYGRINPFEVREVKRFDPDKLPAFIDEGVEDMLQDALRGAGSCENCDKRDNKVVLE